MNWDGLVLYGIYVLINSYDQQHSNILIYLLGYWKQENSCGRGYVLMKVKKESVMFSVRRVQMKISDS